MKETILFCLSSVESHFPPTLELARRLVTKGYRVLYLGFENLECTVRQEGFDYYSIKRTGEAVFLRMKLEFQYFRLSKIYKDLFKEIKDVLVSERVTIVLYDITRFHLYYLPALETDIPIISFWTNSGETHFNHRVAPNSSIEIPNGSIKGTLIATSLWVTRYIRREFFKPKINLYKYCFPFSKLRREARFRNLLWRYSLDGYYLESPKIIFGPYEFEFLYSNENRRSYSGLCVDLNRDETGIFFEWERLEDDKPIIYCSLGTMSNRYEESISFFRTVIEAFRQRKGWKLVMNIGNIQDIKCLGEIPENVIIGNKIPQLSIIRRSALVLSHGGFGTIKECIALSVPMVIFPCIYDQPGNAARVEYHQIGECYGISHVDSKMLIEIIQRMLASKVYKDNIVLMKERINAYDYLDNGVGLISEIINTKKGKMNE
ncbi:glycosyltransferase [Paenibacillus sp. ClWae2A]|uniref:glycosyltransferase n=1 Tax=Paenibacillus sp. ClWae2A TaxID=3057177 RepID=UPI0028F648B3|nr:glycosyltransferase [Paenibacillus sp. ClWae2A]MDT9722443.1 glycosyltransferase [Paenibacillus sp. ClWae2A]